VTAPLLQRLSGTPTRSARAPAVASLPAEAEYWLARCEGFRVEDAAGTVGMVEYVVVDPLFDRPSLVVVRQDGLKRHRTMDVPVDGVLEIRPAERRLVLGSAW
jgi:hypothetical protein